MPRRFLPAWLLSLRRAPRGSFFTGRVLFGDALDAPSGPQAYLLALRWTMWRGRSLPRRCRRCSRSQPCSPSSLAAPALRPGPGDGRRRVGMRAGAVALSPGRLHLLRCPSAAAARTPSRGQTDAVAGSGLGKQASPACAWGRLFQRGWGEARPGARPGLAGARRGAGEAYTLPISDGPCTRLRSERRLAGEYLAGLRELYGDAFAARRAERRYRGGYTQRWETPSTPGRFAPPASTGRACPRVR